MSALRILRAASATVDVIGIEMGLPFIKSRILRAIRLSSLILLPRSAAQSEGRRHDDRVFTTEEGNSCAIIIGVQSLK